MKLGPRDLSAMIAAGKPRGMGLLIYGTDAMRVALTRQDLVAALIGPEGEAEMRLTRLAGSDLRRDPAALSAALRAQGFFPGQRVVLLEDAGDPAPGAIADAMATAAEGDAFLIVTAGQLTARAKLRKLFESAHELAAAAIYTDPASREEIERALTRAGLLDLPPALLPDVTALGRTLDPGDFRQTLEKIALFAGEDQASLTAADLQALAPAAAEPEIEAAINLAAEGAVTALSQQLVQIQRTANATGFCIQAHRHFRTLHLAASDPGGPEAALGRARPPVFGPRRERMARQARAWGPARLARVLGWITDTDLALRSSRPLPALAMVERLFIRIAMQVRVRR